MTKHACAAVDCEIQIPLRMLMCKTHWFKVPKPLRDAVWNHYREGQEHDLDLSREYVLAVRAAVQAVAEQERKV